MFAIAFDLSVDAARRHHPKGDRQAYRDIKVALSRHGYQRVQGSVYVAEDENLVRLCEAMTALRALGWFGKCIKPSGSSLEPISPPLCKASEQSSRQVEQDHNVAVTPRRRSSIHFPTRCRGTTAASTR